MIVWFLVLSFIRWWKLESLWQHCRIFERPGFSLVLQEWGLAVCGSQGNPAYSVHFNSFTQKGEQQTWMRFKECNKEDQRLFLRTASAQAVTQWTAALWSRNGDSQETGLKSVELSCTEKVEEEQLLTASSAASLRFRWEAQSEQKALALGKSSGAAVNPLTDMWKLYIYVGSESKNSLLYPEASDSGHGWAANYLNSGELSLHLPFLWYRVRCCPCWALLRPGTSSLSGTIVLLSIRVSLLFCSWSSTWLSSLRILSFLSSFLPAHTSSVC